MRVRKRAREEERELRFTVDIRVNYYTMFSP